MIQFYRKPVIDQQSRLFKKLNFQGFSIRPIDMYDLLQIKYSTVNKITNAFFKKNHYIVIL